MYPVLTDISPWTNATLYKLQFMIHVHGSMLQTILHVYCIYDAHLVQDCVIVALLLHWRTYPLSATVAQSNRYFIDVSLEHLVQLCASFVGEIIIVCISAIIFTHLPRIPIAPMSQFSINRSLFTLSMSLGSTSHQDRLLYYSSITVTT